jgi:glycosyltransferase involved in cell wall biosynthesis
MNMNHPPIKRLAVTGNPFFLARHRQLTAAMRKHIADVVEVPVEKSVFEKMKWLVQDGISGRIRLPLRQSIKMRMQAFAKQPSTFQELSALTATQIKTSNPTPELVLQLFSMSSPAGAAGVPYAHYIDITMAMAKRAWPEWAPFESDSEYGKWLELEGATYRRAERVFTFSEATRRSVIQDYGASASRVLTVGAAGHYDGASRQPRRYGNRAIIFNGSDFDRKGGDRVLAAFEIVRQRFPDASLTVVGCAAVKEYPGVRFEGKITRQHLFSLFDESDVVLAPTRLDVLPGFVLEAMSRGVVPVLSDADSMSEIITDGLEGHIVSPPVPALLADRICTLFGRNDRLSAMGAAARTRVTRSWNWDTVAQSMITSFV